MFFPDPVFGWVYCAALVLLTCVAAWVDTRTAKIPNRLNVLIFALGILVNAVRGGWLAATDRQVWWLSEYSPGAVWLGVIDGVLFALVGFLVAFAIMYLAWMFGMCGGGDVKLVAAVATWVGVERFPFLWIGSGVILVVWMTARAFSGGISPKQMQRKMAKYRKDNAERATGRAEGKALPTPKPGKLRVTYSVPVAVATTLMLLWLHRVELGLAQPKPQPQPDQQNGAIAHARPPIEPA